MNVPVTSNLVTTDAYNYLKGGRVEQKPKPQGTLCKIMCLFGHKHDKHGRHSAPVSTTTSLSSVDFTKTPPMGRKGQLYNAQGGHANVRGRALSAPASLKGSREDLRADGAEKLALQKRYSDPTPVRTASAASNYQDAVKSFDYARNHTKKDKDKIRFFIQGVDYAKRAAALGYKEAATILQREFKNPLISRKDGRELVNDHKAATFWNGVLSELKKGIPPQEQVQMQFGRIAHVANNRVAAARMINLSASLHYDSYQERPEFPISHIGELVGQLDSIIEGSKAIPQNLMTAFAQKEKGGTKTC